MNFRQFAFNNVRRNARAYSAYFLSSSFAVMIFFTYAMFIFHPDMTKTELGKMTQIGMQAAEYVIFVFSFLFVLYSISAFLKARKKEFGILTILGAEGRQLNRLIFLENMIIGSASIIAGMGSGIILSKLFLLLGAKVVERNELPLYLPWKAMGLTIAAFLGLFLVISFLTLFFVRQNRVLELLQGSSKPKLEPKASIWLSLLSASSFVAAFYLMKPKLSQSTMILILVLGIIGTYFLFTHLSVFIICLLKKNRLFFWRGTNLLWISEMAYKIKDNARMFFMVTIVTAMSCSTIGIVLALDQRDKQMFTEDLFAFHYLVFSEGDWQADIAKIDQELDHAGIKYEKIKIVSTHRDVREIDSYPDMIKQSDYNRLANVLHLKKAPTLKSGEAILISSPLAKDKEKLKNIKLLTVAKGRSTLAVVNQFEKTILGTGHLVVVSDSTYDQLKSSNPEHLGENIQISYFVPEWSNDQVPSSSSLEVKMGQKLTKWNRDRLEINGGDSGLFISRAEQYVSMKQSTSVKGFIGVFIAVIFSISTASFLYFKLYTDLNQERHIVHVFSKIGLSPKEMKTSSTIQIAALFFIPLFVAALETIISLSALKEQFYLGNTFIPAMIGIGAFFAVQFIYFLVVRARYLSQLKRVMV